ncbi:MAG: diacylglycerol kinase family protein [Planctomycetota bacterium]|nr:diacylglycerol kinase family protein [Planctomycetota bacterium]
MARNKRGRYGGSVPTKRFKITDRIQSFRFAFQGLGLLIRTQHNSWIHLISTVLVLALGFHFEVTRGEWCLLILAIGQVWIAEALNTAIEFLGDAVTLERNPLIGKAKDVAAGAVLLSALGALAIGLFVFLPYF